jgi:hypothetical protein
MKLTKLQAILAKKEEEKGRERRRRVSQVQDGNETEGGAGPRHGEDDEIE